MFSAEVKEIVASGTSRLKETNTFFLAAQSGNLSPETMNRYLQDLMWIFNVHSCRLITAGEKAQIRGQFELVNFFKLKYIEEFNHYQWPQNDLKKRGIQAQLTDVFVSESAKKLISHLDQLIDKDPLLFLSYMTVLEYLTVLAAPEFMESLESKCGIPRESLTSIDYHAQADIKHVEDDFEVVNELVKSESQKLAFKEALVSTLSALGEFFDSTLLGNSSC